MELLEADSGFLFLFTESQNADFKFTIGLGGIPFHKITMQDQIGGKNHVSNMQAKHQRMMQISQNQGVKINNIPPNSS